MKLATRLLAAPLLAASVALTAGGIYGALTLRASAQARAAFANDVSDFKTAVHVQEKLGAVHASVYRTLAILNSLDDGKVSAYLKAATQQLAEVQREAAGMVGADDHDAALQAAVAATTPLFERYQQSIGKAIELSSVDPNMGVAAMNAAEKSHSELSAALGKVVARIAAANEEHSAAARAFETRLALWLGALGLLATAGALGWAWAAQRRLVGEINEAAQLSEQVAKGNLTSELNSSRRDEIGDLARSLASMVKQLRSSLHTVRAATGNIAGASVEIASGNLDLSQRTEQTAASLQATASSMSQLTCAVRQSADAAAQADQLASSAAEVAQRGGKVVAEVVTTMQAINSSSKKIADIIGTIDGIAFQTNILALNAAVEAARAGEQGRGFAVVASEVRSLAGRSAEAAREIKALIGRSVEKVESGTRLVGDAGATMTEIVASVQRVSDIIGEISAAAAEQSSGIHKVNQAVSELDRMTQQNAALVEESAAAAESLKAQAVTLGEVVGKFELGDGPSAESAAPSASSAIPGATGARSVARAVVAKAQSHAKAAPSKTNGATSAPARKAPPADKPSAAPATTANTGGGDGDGNWTSF